MIARITGILRELNTDANAVLLDVADIGYEILVPGYAISELSTHLGQKVTLHTWQYFESSGSIGGNLIPRLIGFPQAQDKLFFQKFITVKGIGARKALRALAKSLGDIADYIERGDAKMLSTLPEIGKRTAEQIIAELKGKMDIFALAATHHRPAPKALGSVERETLEILTQLGEKLPDADEIIAQIRKLHPEINTTDALVQAFYRAKAGALK